MKRGLITLSIVLIAAGLSLTSHAAPLNTSVLSADANWVVHADFDMFNQSAIGKLIRKELAEQGVEEQLQNFATVFSVHPLDDIQNVTVYGKGKDKAKAVAMIQGTFRPEVLIALVNMNPDYEKSNFGDYTIHSWIDEKKDTGERQYGCFYNDNTLLMSVPSDGIKTALDVLDGKVTNASENKSLVDLLRKDKGMFLTATAEKVYEAANEIEEVAMLEKMSRLSIALGEFEGRTYLDMTLQARSPEDALNVQQFLQGMLALVSLSQSEEMPQLAQLVSSIKINVMEDIVQVHFDKDSNELMTILKELSDIKSDIQIEAKIDL